MSNLAICTVWNPEPAFKKIEHNNAYSCSKSNNSGSSSSARNVSESSIDSNNLSNIVIEDALIYAPPPRPLLPLPSVKKSKSLNSKSVEHDEISCIPNETSEQPVDLCDNSVPDGDSQVNEVSFTTSEYEQNVLSKLRKRTFSYYPMYCTEVWKHVHSYKSSLRGCSNKYYKLNKKFSSIAPNRYRQQMIELLFERFGSHSKITDEVIAAAINTFDLYSESCNYDFLSHSYNHVASLNSNGVSSKLPSNAQYIASKETIVASLLLSSKLENIRHLSLRSSCELAGIQSKVNIIKREHQIFLTLNSVMLMPSAPHFIKALIVELLGGATTLENLYRQEAYHLTMYIYFLNLSHKPLALMLPEMISRACVWVTVIILKIPVNPSIQRLASQVDNRFYYSLCRKLVYRALEMSQVLDHPINNYYSSSRRKAVREILLRIVESPTY